MVYLQTYTLNWVDKFACRLCLMGSLATLDDHKKLACLIYIYVHIKKVRFLRKLLDFSGRNSKREGCQKMVLK